MKLTPEIYQFLINQALEEDLGTQGDITTQAIFDNETATSVIFAKEPGVLAGIEIAKQVFKTVDKNCEFLLKRFDGDLFYKNDTILEISAPVQSLLKAERTALNFLGRLSGIASFANQFVKKVLGTTCKILDTRKTTPGWRKLEKYAVICGGGTNHRVGLYDMVLIKDNHIAAAGGITPAVQRIRSYLEEMNIPVEIEVEVSNLNELQEAVSLDVDRIMLDNMSLDTMKDAVKICAGQIPLEASGNVNIENVQAVARTGVNFISIGALTHSAHCVDFSMKMKK
jgi:nicotinate-nucleotide pyrophosphorylase (carboxylating)